MSQQHELLRASLEQNLKAFDWPGQADWLPGLREAGREQFRLNGLPGRSVERWKYTRLGELEQRGVLVSSLDNPEMAQPKPLLQSVPRVVMLDGQCVSIEGNLPAGLHVQSLERALSQEHPVLEKMLTEVEIRDRAAALAALNTATLRHGLYIEVEPGVDAGEILVQWLSSAADQLVNSRVCIQLADGARLRLVEQYESAESAGFANVVNQVGLSDSAHFEHVRLQQEHSDTVLVTLTEASQARNSHYAYSGLDFGGGTVRHDVRARLLEEGASCSLNGASLTRGRSHVDNHLDAEHLAENCASRQYFRAVLGDRSRVVFNGRVFVASGADGTDAQQSSAGLLLSPLAEIDSKPELEIYADEVVASHGATVGQIDSDQLFYLQSRGIDPDAARTMLTMAFCKSVIEHVDSEALRETLEARLQACLDAAGVSNG